MSCPSNRTLPRTRAPRTISCIRLRQRMKVDLPQPDGPMTAVTAFRGTSMLTCLTTCWAPNHAFRSFTTIPSATAPSLSPSTCHGPRHDVEREDECDQHERARPRLPVPVVEGTRRVHIDLQRQRRDRLADTAAPVLVSECGEEERCRLPGHPGHRQQDPGHDSGPGRGT